jgi:hypothetical protein
MKIDKYTSPCAIEAVTIKQAYEWVKTGYWTFNEFNTWYVVQLSAEESPLNSDDIARIAD